MAGDGSTGKRGLRPRLARLSQRVRRELGPAVRLARLDLALSRLWARNHDALRRTLDPASAEAYTRIVLVVAESDPGIARVVAHSIPDRMASLDAPDRSRFIRLIEAVAHDRLDALPLVVRTLPGLLPELDDQGVARYLARGLDLHQDSARKAESFLRMESEEGRRSADRLQRGLALQSVQRTLSLYARAHCGRDVMVRAGDGAFTDGRHLHLPARIDRFGDERDFLLYRVLTARAAGYLEFGTLDLDLASVPGEWPERDAGELEVERLLRSFANVSLARDLFGILEERRIEQRVRRAYPGISRDLDKLADDWRPALRDPATLAPAEQAVEYLLRRARGLEAPVLPSGPAQAAAEQAEPALQRVEAEEASVADTVAALQQAYPFLDTLLRRVQEEDLERIPDLFNRQGEGQADGADERGGASQRNDGSPEREQPRSNNGPSERSGEEEYQARPVDPLEAGLRTERLAPEDRAREDQALRLLDALRSQPDADTPDLSELRQQLHEEGRSYEAMSDFLDRNQGPSGPVSDQRSPPPGVEGREPSGGTALEKDAIKAERQFLYPEWDGGIEDHKPDWVRVTEYELAPGSREFVDQVRAEHGPLVSQIRRAFEALRPEAVRRLRGLLDGEELDMDRLIQARIERRAGGAPDERFYARRVRQERDVAVAFLVDMSSSTNEVVGLDERRVLDIEKEALVLIAEAVDAIGDQSAIWGFSGYGRDQVAFYIAKDFGDAWDESVAERIGRMSWKMENRDGAAIRHATWKLSQVPSRVKLLLLLSDGKPLDCGCDHYADAYAQDDTRRALQEARANGVHPFCITVDPGGADYLGRLYGETGFTVIDRVEALPQRLPRIYRRLTR